MKYIDLVPAYSRDYKSKKELLADWEANKDFQIVSVNHPDYGRYVNKQSELPSGTVLNVRYKRLTQIAVIKVK